LITVFVYYTLHKKQWKKQKKSDDEKEFGDDKLYLEKLTDFQRTSWVAEEFYCRSILKTPTMTEQ
jgi:hypothetical protein